MGFHQLSETIACELFGTWKMSFFSYKHIVLVWITIHDSFIAQLYGDVRLIHGGFYSWELDVQQKYFAI